MVFYFHHQLFSCVLITNQDLLEIGSMDIIWANPSIHPAFPITFTGNNSKIGEKHRKLWSSY